MKISYGIALLLLAGCASQNSKSDLSGRAPANSSELTTRDGKAVSLPPLKISLSLPACPPDMSSTEECTLPNEAALFDEVVQDTFTFQSAQNPPTVKVSQRDFHPRQHACVAGLWHPTPGLAKNLAQGALASNQTVPVVLRFSNGSPKSPAGNDQSPPDFAPDARGLAIKLVGVPGDGILDIEDPQPNATNQDFILINFPAFFLRTPKSYPTFLTSITKGQSFFSIMDPLELSVLKATNRVVPDVMAERFWTQVPSKLGQGYAKFSVQLCKPEAASPVTPEEMKNPRFLRERIRARLAKGPICLSFMAQPKAPQMKVEDAAVEWKESDAPFVEVGRIEIPSAQNINDPTRDAYCENTSFNPWNALEGTRPAGAMNRARLAVYSGVSRKRRMENSTPIREPKPTDSFFDVLKGN